MSQESEIISFFSFSNNSKKIKNSEISLLAVYSIFCIFEADFKIRKMKKRSIFLTIFFFSIFVRTLKYANMIRISNTSFFRFCWKNGKLHWPKCARTVMLFSPFQFSKHQPKRVSLFWVPLYRLQMDTYYYFSTKTCYGRRRSLDDFINSQ